MVFKLGEEALCDLYCPACICNQKFGCPMFGGQFPMLLGSAILFQRGMGFVEEVVVGLWRGVVVISHTDFPKVMWPSYPAEGEN